MNHEDNAIDFDDLAHTAAGAVLVALAFIVVVTVMLWAAAAPDRPERCADAGAEVAACVMEGV